MLWCITWRGEEGGGGAWGRGGGGGGGKLRAQTVVVCVTSVVVVSTAVMQTHARKPRPVQLQQPSVMHRHQRMCGMAN